MPTSFLRAAFCRVAAVWTLWLGSELCAAATLERYDGQINRVQLEHLLSRAVSMEGLLHEHGNLDDEIRFLKNTGVRFAGRTIYLWGGEKNLPAALNAARLREGKVHQALPELMLQAALFEIVTEAVETQIIPSSVAKEFGHPAPPRPFSYTAMLFPETKRRNQWGKGSSVPDITQAETQMWFYYLATRYIDLGVEAIHFGQVALMGARDPQNRAWDSLLTRVRRYARQHARRGIVLCDAHVPRGGILVDERLLLDFHSFPLRIDEVPDRPLKGVLKMGYLDSLYGRSKGGTTPSGWSCEHLPYLVEFDNFGRSGREGQNIGKHWIWGYDEISWFARLPRAERDRWLRYAWNWVREHDPNGYVQMPGSRTLAAAVDGKSWYWASDPTPACPAGFGDESTIREIWQGD